MRNTYFNMYRNFYFLLVSTIFHIMHKIVKTKVNVKKVSQPNIITELYYNYKVH